MRRSLGAALAVAASLAVASGPSRADAVRPDWPGSFVGRVEALALVQTLNATLLAARSATFTLEAWCADHRMAETPRLVATLKKDVVKPVTAEQRERLQIGPEEPVKYRRVLLSCGSHVLSEADNWYVPSRLTPEMNRLLETTDTPFGRAVADLKPFRRTFAANLLWSPLPAGWEMGKADTSASGDAPLAIPGQIFEHRALLYTPDTRPFCEVTETYSQEILAFPPPAR